jgi:hypothetical protein
MYSPLFGKSLRKVTVELTLSAIIVSLIEESALIYFGFLKMNGIFNLLLATAILALIELALMFLVEEFLIAAKYAVRRKLNRQHSLHHYTK